MTACCSPKCANSIADALHARGSLPQLAFVWDFLRKSGSRRRAASAHARQVTSIGELAANVMSPRAGFHADQAARNVGQPALKLSAQALQLQNDRPRRWRPTRWKLFLPRSMPIVPTAVDDADLCEMGRAPCASQFPARLYVLQGRSTAGPS